MTTNTPAGFPLAGVPFVDKNGILTRDWLYFLQALFVRTGNETGQGFVDEKGLGGTFGFVGGVDFIAGTTKILHLSNNYQSAANLFVAFDGTWQGADQFTLSGSILTFISAIPVGTGKVFVKGFL